MLTRSENCGHSVFENQYFGNFEFKRAMINEEFNDINRKES